MRGLSPLKNQVSHHFEQIILDGFGDVCGFFVRDFQMSGEHSVRLGPERYQGAKVTVSTCLLNELPLQQNVRQGQEVSSANSPPASLEKCSEIDLRFTSHLTSWRVLQAVLEDRPQRKNSVVEHRTGVHNLSKRALLPNTESCTSCHGKKKRQWLRKELFWSSWKIGLWRKMRSVNRSWLK